MALLDNDFLPSSTAGQDALTGFAMEQAGMHLEEGHESLRADSSSFKFLG